MLGIGGFGITTSPPAPDDKKRRFKLGGALKIVLGIIALALLVEAAVLADLLQKRWKAKSAKAAQEIQPESPREPVPTVPPQAAQEDRAAAEKAAADREQEAARAAQEENQRAIERFKEVGLRLAQGWTELKDGNFSAAEETARKLEASGVEHPHIAAFRQSISSARAEHQKKIEEEARQNAREVEKHRAVQEAVVRAMLALENNELDAARSAMEEARAIDAANPAIGQLAAAMEKKQEDSALGVSPFG